LSDRSEAERNRERQELASWYRGDRARPFILKRHEPEYCVCDVLFPQLGGRWGFARRGLQGRLAQRLPGSALRLWAYRRLGARIGRGVFISPGAMLDPLFPELIEIADDVFLGLGCRIFAHEYTAESFRLGRVKIGRGSVIGAGAIVRSGVTIGEKATIGFLSFVNKDVPEGARAAGVPARVLRDGETEAKEGLGEELA